MVDLKDIYFGGFCEIVWVLEQSIPISAPEQASKIGVHYDVGDGNRRSIECRRCFGAQVPGMCCEFWNRGCS